jgi:hypothetical protein
MAAARSSMQAALQEAQDDLAGLEEGKDRHVTKPPARIVTSPARATLRGAASLGKGMASIGKGMVGLLGLRQPRQRQKMSPKTPSGSDWKAVGDDLKKALPKSKPKGSTAGLEEDWQDVATGTSFKKGVQILSPGGERYLIDDVTARMPWKPGQEMTLEVSPQREGAKNGLGTHLSGKEVLSGGWKYKPAVAGPQDGPPGSLTYDQVVGQLAGLKGKLARMTLYPSANATGFSNQGRGRFAEDPVEWFLSASEFAFETLGRAKTAHFLLMVEGDHADIRVVSGVALGVQSLRGPLSKLSAASAPTAAGLEEGKLEALVAETAGLVREIAASGRLVAVLVEDGLTSFSASGLEEQGRQLRALPGFPMLALSFLNPGALSRYRGEGYTIIRLVLDQPDAPPSPDTIYVKVEIPGQQIPAEVLPILITDALATWKKAQGRPLERPLRLDVRVYIQGARGLTADDVWRTLANYFA